MCALRRATVRQHCRICRASRGGAQQGYKSEIGHASLISSAVQRPCAAQRLCGGHGGPSLGVAAQLRLLGDNPDAPVPSRRVAREEADDLVEHRSVACIERVRVDPIDRLGRVAERVLQPGSLPRRRRDQDSIALTDASQKTRQRTRRTRPCPRRLLRGAGRDRQRWSAARQRSASSRVHRSSVPGPPDITACLFADGAERMAP